MPRGGHLSVAAVLASASACRWVAYLGREEMSGEDLLLHRSHNLVEMAVDDARLEACPGSRSSRRFNASQFALRNVDENLDGFGVAWYADDSDFPRRVRSGEPIVAADGRPHELFRALFSATAPTFLAANNTCQSLLPESTKVLKSKAILAHVRAASPGLATRTANAHPFTFNTLSWVHNGCIAAFDRVVRERPSSSSLVAGSTDSEFAGALFADNLRGFPQGPTYALASLTTAMRRTLREIGELTAEFTSDASSLNFAVTDGHSLVASRYRTAPDEDPPTLYYKPITHGVIVASEPLDLDELDANGLAAWTLLGKDRILSYSPDEGLSVDCVDNGPDSACDADTPAAIPLLAAPPASSFAEERRQRRRGGQRRASSAAGQRLVPQIAYSPAP